jgi:hypothetical protein
MATEGPGVDCEACLLVVNDQVNALFLLSTFNACCL